MDNKKADKIIKAFVSFVDKYNAEDHGGKAEVIETPRNITIYLYNAGWSENEYLEASFLEKNDVKWFLVVNDHPCMVFRLDKFWWSVFGINDISYESLRKTQYYKKKKVFKYDIRIE